MATSRRRGEELYAAIFEATLAELAEAGYARLTMERVAARAGASKMSLYRRWPSRHELVIAALQHRDRAPDPVPDTGNLRDDMLVFLRQAAVLLDGAVGEAVRGLMAESLLDPGTTASARADAFSARDQLVRAILDRAAARGEIQASAVTPQLAGLAPALVDHYFLTQGAPIPDDLLTGIVDDILLPLLTMDR
jgi:AcrR family transcriptional regulator